MDIDRRRLIAISALSTVPVATLATPTMAAPLSTSDDGLRRAALEP